MLPKLLAGALLTLGPLVGIAQTAPRLYLGASGSLTRLYPFESYAKTSAGPAITAGLSLTPHWAIETGAQLAWTKQAGSGSFSINGTTFLYDASSRNRTLIVPLLARYTLTAASSHLRVDLLGGATWLHQAIHAESTSADGSGLTTQYRTDYTLNDICVTLGPQLRYALGSKVDLKLSVPVSLRVSHPSETKFASRLLFTPQLGVQYAF